MRIFLKNACLRPSCYNCKFKGLNRNSDITLGDFWGVEGLLEELNDDKGVSLVLVNSEKGQHFFDRIKESCFVKEVAVEDALLNNLAAMESMKMNKHRRSFFEDLKKNSIEKVIKKYSKTSKIKSLINYCFLVFHKIRVKASSLVKR